MHIDYLKTVALPIVLPIIVALTVQSDLLSWKQKDDFLNLKTQIETMADDEMVGRISANSARILVLESKH